MSYVPKYVLKRMVPEDAMKKVPGGGELTLINMVANVPVDQIPGDPADIIGIKLNDKELTKDEISKIEVYVDDKKYMFNDLKDAGSIAVNTKLKFFMPGAEFNVGDELTITIDVAMVDVHIDITRTVTE